MRIPATSVAISLLLAGSMLGGCGSDPSGTPPDASPDPVVDSGTDAANPDAAPPPPATITMVFSNGVEPCEYPDGQTRVCPADHNRELFVLDFDPETGTASTPIRLTDNSDGIAPPVGSSAPTPDDDFFRALSPDGKWVYFVNGLGGTSNIYRTRTDGSLAEPERISPEGSDAGFVALSADGTTLWAFVDGALHRMDADGQNAENLTADIAELGSLQALLPDESGFVFKRGSGHDPDGIDDDGELYLFRLADRQMVRLTDDRVNNSLAGISPDNHIFFTGYDDENNDGALDDGGGKNLWVMPADLSVAARRITDVAGLSIELMAISPDGSHIIYEHRLESTGKKEIFSLPAEGGTAVQLSDSPGGESSYFRVLSPDGQTVIYTSNDRPGGFGDTELYTVPITGGPSTLLTNFENESYFLPDLVLASLDLIIYHSPLDGDTDLFAVPVAGGEHLDLTRNDGWSDTLEGVAPDGSFIFFTNLSDEPVYDDQGNLSPESDTDIYASRTDGTGEVIQVTHNYVYDRVEAVVVLDGEVSTERRRSWVPAAARHIDDGAGYSAR